MYYFQYDLPSAIGLRCMSVTGVAPFFLTTALPITQAKRSPRPLAGSHGIVSPTHAHTEKELWLNY